MKVTKDLLQKALRDPFILVPHSSSSTTEEPWWRQAMPGIEHGTKVSQWGACQWIGVLFDTYGELIEKIQLRFELDQRKGCYMTSSVYINDEYVDEGAVYDDMYEPMRALDNSACLREAVFGLNDCAHSYLLANLLDFQENFNDVDFTCAKQARQLAQEISPEINVWFNKMVLTEVSRNARKGIKTDKQTRPPKM